MKQCIWNILNDWQKNKENQIKYKYLSNDKITPEKKPHVYFRDYHLMEKTMAELLF